VGGITLICGYYQVVFWTTAGERQAQKFREAYVHSILSQEVGWFDTNSPSTLSTKVADLVGKVQDGMGRKFGDFIFNIVQFFASIIISFYLSWKLSLVLLVSIPAVMAAGTSSCIDLLSFHFISLFFFFKQVTIW
jgi:ABC-type multidrug transport system fused ATPase/permease subunit